MAGVPSDRPLLDAVVRADGGDPAKVETKNVGFSLSPALAAGKVDAVIGAYWNIELVELERQGVRGAGVPPGGARRPGLRRLVVVTSDEIARAAGAGGGVPARPARRPGLGRDRRGRSGRAPGGRQRRPRPRGREGAARPHGGRPFPADEPTLNVDSAEWSAFAAWMLDNGLLEELVPAEAVDPGFLPEEPTSRACR